MRLPSSARGDTYDHGERDKIDVRENIPKGGESRVIDLHGEGQRSIRKIEFWYDTKGSGQGTADVTVFGMKQCRGWGWTCRPKVQ